MSFKASDSLSPPTTTIHYALVKILPDPLSTILFMKPPPSINLSFLYQDKHTLISVLYGGQDYPENYHQVTPLPPPSSLLIRKYLLGGHFLT